MRDQDKTADKLCSELEFSEKLLSASSFGVATFTADGKCISANEAMRSIIEATQERVWRKDFKNAASWKRSGLLVDAYEVLSTGVGKQRELHIVTALEKEMWLDCRLSLISTSGKPWLVLIVNDITHHKRAEEALRHSEEMLRGILSVSPVGIGLTLNRKIRWVNEAWAKMFGFENEYEWAGKSAKLVYSSQREYERVGKLLYEDLNPGQGAETEAQFRRKDGTTFDGYVRIRALDASDPDKGTIAVMYDITDRRKAEEALRESEERFRTLFEAAEDSIFIKGRDLKYTYVNPAMERLFGIPSSEILGRRAEQLFGEETGQIIKDGDRRVLKGQSIESEHTGLLKGVFRTVHEVRVPMKSLTGKIVGICGISREITERQTVRPNRMIPAPEHYPSAAMRATLREARFASATDSIVLLLGESGSGKDYLARWIHDHSRRSSGPYFSVNCAAISKELAESELFGHEAGAFTGASSRKRGLLELAEGGTLLLNEIGELPLSLQSKLLTFLDTKSFLRVGGDKSIHINARLIVATHRNLETEVAEGRFLAALFYRLNVFGIEVPPLRDRIEDIPMLVDEIVSALGPELQLTQSQVIDVAGMNRLMRYSWPGNVRELRNVLERALMLSYGEHPNIMLPTLEKLSSEWVHNVRFTPGRSLHEITDEVTQSLCEYALRHCGGSRKEAARLLDISRGALYRYMKRLGIPRDNETLI
jgi:PAS domain S-box-containing protein